MSDLCEYQTYAATLETPAEYCEEDAVEGEEYCPGHLLYEPDPDR